MNSEAYKPVSCALHSELELAIMHGSRLQIQCTDAATITLDPRDIITRSIAAHKHKGEFLIGNDASGQTVEIRLDKIQSIK